jgi:hypothetical protein
MATNASCTPANFALSDWTIAPAGRCSRTRSSAGLSVTKTMPAFDALTKPLMERPGKATALATPGSFRAMADIFRITSSVRSSEAASGSWAKATR